jgi:sugar lactone lactonase YvrE
LLLSDFHAHNVSLDTDGNLVTAHGEGHHTMVRVAGNKVTDTLFTSLSFEEFNGGNCTYTSNGDIIFGIEHFLWRIDKDGKKSKLSDFRFEWNQTVFSDTEGNYYAPDIGRDHGAVIKIDPEGNGRVIATNLISNLDREYDKHNDVLLGIGKDTSGWLYIAETAGKRIIKFNEEGEQHTFYTSERDWFPNGITFFNGDAYILEVKMDNGYEGPRIKRISSDGASEVIFNYDTYKNPESTISNNKEEEDNVNLIWLYIGLIGIVVVALVIYRKLRAPVQHLP